ncbi:MAG: glycoside hydrolase family 2 TIM barrel-domain containing protein [Pseudomonadota bacterium]
MQTQTGWQLLRAGEPYFVRGAGGDASFELLAAAGGNSVRTWSVDDAGEVLDRAHAHGLTVTLGIWLGHERHGFDYADPAQRAAQLQRVREAVIRYRDHPALLIWALGNEMEGFGDGDDPQIWAHVNEAAQLVKQLDPHHPTMTVTAEIGGDRIRYVHDESDAIDIHGINAYGGAASLPKRLQAAGATKPYIITEFGPPGPWEVAKSEWGAPYELTSTEKAAAYRQTYERAIVGNRAQALGSYAFLWGSKVEGTPTWFGLFLRTGERLAAIDALHELWSGAQPKQPAPTISPIEIEAGVAHNPGEAFVARLSTDAGAAAVTTWHLLPESNDYATGGDFRVTPVAVEDAVFDTTVTSARIVMPEQPGAYRLFATLRDQHGAAATANVPLLVRGEVGTRFPVYVYHDGFAGMRWAPSGWMGNIEALSLIDNDTTNPFRGEHAIRMRYTAQSGWAAIAWQHPANDWGDQQGGFDLTGASRIELWARGEYGGELIEWGIGLLGDDAAYPDSVNRRHKPVRLTSDWQRYEIPLRGKDLTTIKTPFVITVTGRSTPVTVYLDNIRFVR